MRRAARTMVAKTAADSENERLLERLDRAAIFEKAAIALAIARERGDVEVEAKYQQLDPALFWAWLAQTKPAYVLAACAALDERVSQDHDQQVLFDGDESLTASEERK